MNNRRQVLAGLVGLGLAGPALAQTDSLVADSEADQSSAFQAALHAASGTGYLRLPAGRFRVSGIQFPRNLVVEGVPGATWLVGMGAPVGAISGQASVVLRDIGFAGDSGADALLRLQSSQGVVIERCLFRDSPDTALNIYESDAVVRDCDFASHGDAAIHAVDNLGLLLSGNRITRCGNAGIRVWRSEAGPDGSIVVNNRISNIDWRDGGNGQNGNGINVYLADQVIVADNHIADCAFTAVRLNTTRNTQVSGNQCLNSGEVAIFSEFGFSGSVIANNIVDGAAGGISITNMDSGGEVAVCNGNIVRNIAVRSEVNPDTTPFGIFAEADAAITGNMVENVPGIAIGAGWGPYLRNVVIANNVVTASRIGIGVSVAEGAGNVSISGNRVDASEHAIAGMAWSDVVAPDLLASAADYPNVSVR
ncbi:twin-arg-translocated uncharacterized repeat-containing protein [Devosia lucknowensis]|uniref:Twin-arg-translocated uncharacterized repeat-containing protein n=1 Tax=Devosia lucknowensis TaxID=1096929 RepID=A0A1Y6EE28_9HYPH|nr:TIGR03808 family TAT-translocated repetitive protein [Devosia lucknowensis]SMQ60848.1 twin-arg-translocated uncharacterized repeat-containing protein [Devosia lucknowensis]